MVQSLTFVLPYFPTATMERITEEGQIATAMSLARMVRIELLCFEIDLEELSYVCVCMGSMGYMRCLHMGHMYVMYVMCGMDV